MSLNATAHSIPGTLRQEVVIDGRHRLITDEPEHLGGEGSGPAPHELLTGALAACISTTLVMYARVKGWDLGDVSVAVDYDNHSTPRRFDVRVELGGELADGQLARLEKVAASCAVRRSLEARPSSSRRSCVASPRPHASSRQQDIRPEDGADRRGQLISSASSSTRDSPESTTRQREATASW